MPQISGFVPAPLQGVSQASSSVRLTEQATLLDNLLVELPDGLRKRPPIDYIGRLFADAANVSFNMAALIVDDPDDGSQVYLLIRRVSTVTTVYLFNALTLAPIAVTVSAAAQTYLNSGVTNPREDIALNQAVDYTIITNRTKQVTVNATLNPVRPPEAILWIKTGEYGRKYIVQFTNVDGTITGSVQTPLGTNSSAAVLVDTSTICQALFDGPYSTGDSASFTPIGAALITAGYTFSHQGTHTYITHPTKAFTITTQDGLGGEGMQGLQTQVNAFSDLPKIGYPDFTIKVADKSQGDNGSYYVKWEGTGTVGIWKECLGPGAEKGFDVTTMPVGLIKSSGWHLDVLPWKAREVGDEDLAIDPGFVGDYIQDVNYWGGRLAIISNEETLLAATDDPFRCYPSTLTTQIDSDPISLVAPGKSRAKFFKAVKFNRALVIMGELAQAIITSPQDGTVTAETVKIDLLNNYKIPTTITPQGSNDKIYFPQPHGLNYLGISELGIDKQDGLSFADDLTPALPKFIPSTINLVAGLENFYTLLYGEAGGATLYHHIFRYQSAQRVQNGWFRWFLPDGWTLGSILAEEGTSKLHMFLRCNGGLHIGTISYQPLSLDPDPDATILTMLDIRQDASQVVDVTYDDVTEHTTITSDLPINELTRVASSVPLLDDSHPEGYLAEIVSYDASSVVVKGDWSLEDFWLGYEYLQEWIPSTLYYFGKDEKPILSADVTIKSITLDLKDTAAVSVGVTVGRRPERVYSLKVATTDSPSLITGKWRVPVDGKNTDVRIRIYNDTHMPMNVLGFEWIAEYNPKSGRTT